MIANSKQKRVILYFSIQQPRRLRQYRRREAGTQEPYFDEQLEAHLMKQLSRDCYDPANDMLQKLIGDNPGLKICMSISGEAIDQMEAYSPETLLDFKRLSATGGVEWLAQTNSHSFSWMISTEEFRNQVHAHTEKMQQHFNLRPSVFCNTELIYDNEIGRVISQMGFSATITEGAENITTSAGKNKIHRHPDEQIKIVLRDKVLSEDIAFRFGAGESRLSAEKFVDKINALSADNEVVLLGLNYLVLGDHFSKAGGIIPFLRELLINLYHDERFILSSVSEAVDSADVCECLTVPDVVSWARDRHDASTWLGNDMQAEAFSALTALKDKLSQVSDESMLDIWRSLQASDHFYQMTSRKLADTNYCDFTQYPSPYEAFINYMNVLNDFALNITNAPLKEHDADHAKTIECERQHQNVPVWAMKKESQSRLASESHV